MSIDDETLVEFECTRQDNGQSYILKIRCKEGLSSIEYAACLHSFAEDIERGEFEFEAVSGDH